MSGDLGESSQFRLLVTSPDRSKSSHWIATPPVASQAERISEERVAQREAEIATYLADGGRLQLREEDDCTRSDLSRYCSSSAKSHCHEYKAGVFHITPHCHIQKNNPGIFANIRNVLRDRPQFNPLKTPTTCSRRPASPHV